MSERFIAYIDGLAIDQSGVDVPPEATPAALRQVFRDFARAQNIPFHEINLNGERDKPATIPQMVENISRGLFPLQIRNSCGGDLVTSGSGLHLALQAYNESKILRAPDLCVSMAGISGSFSLLRWHIKKAFEERCPIRRLVTVTAHHDPLSSPDLNKAFCRAMAPVVIGGSPQAFTLEGERITAPNLEHVLPHVMNGFGGN